MSLAFIKEDVDLAERPTYQRSAFTQAPRTLNLMTADGAESLYERINALGRVRRNDPTIARLEAALQSATIVQPMAGTNSIVFGSTVHLQNDSGEKAVYRIVGVDEVDQSPHHVSWLSPLGKALLSADGLHARVSLSTTESAVWTVTAIE
jgi:transcription elongation factor GreB